MVHGEGSTPSLGTNPKRLLTLICAYHNKRECSCFLTLISFAYYILHIYLLCD
jgi:hypothetical protein